MKLIPLFFTFIVLTACSNNEVRLNHAIQTEVLALEQNPITDELVNYEILVLQIIDLNKYLGHYPSQIKDQNQRLQIYHKWLNIVANAENYAKRTKDKEKVLYILSELYRQGHNMGVLGSKEKAQQNIETCLQQFKASIQCHLSASFFYLSLGDDYLDQAEKSLRFLRKYYLPHADADTEAGYVILYLLRSEKKKILAQIERFIKNFPYHTRTPSFKKMKAELLK